MREIKFRVWDFLNQKFDTETYKVGDAFGHPSSVDWVAQQFTGLQDSTGQDVYEGDLVEIEYSVGDFAWEFMTDEEANKNEKMLGNKYLCTVEWNADLAAFYLIHGNSKSTHTQFPALYIKHGVVKGNIFQV